jgi:hypothetical protein
MSITINRRQFGIATAATVLLTGTGNAAGLFAQNDTIVPAMAQSFVGYDTAQIMHAYARFFPEIISNRPNLAAEMAAHIAALDANPDTLPVSFKSQSHRYKVLPALVAVHQYALFPEISAELAPHIIAGLNHELPLVREILLQNLITATTAGIHYRTQAADGKLPIQNSHIFDTLSAFYPEAIRNPQYRSLLNSFTIYLNNMRKVLSAADRPDDARQVTRLLDNLYFKLSPTNTHIAAVNAALKNTDPFEINGQTNMLALSPQPTEVFFAIDRLANAGMSKDYIFWLTVERATVLRQNLDKPAVVAKLLGIYRDLGVYDKFMVPFLNAGAADRYKAIDSGFYNFLTRDMRHLVDNVSAYPSEACDPQMLRLMGEAPLLAGYGTNMAARVSAGETEKFAAAMTDPKIDPRAGATAAAAFLSARAGTPVHVTPEQIEVVKNASRQLLDGNTAIHLDTKSLGPA